LNVCEDKSEEWLFIFDVIFLRVCYIFDLCQKCFFKNKIIMKLFSNKVIIKYSLFIFFECCFSFLSFSQLTDRVLVIKNLNSPVSIAVADDYMSRRNITKVLNITCQNSATDPNLESISFTDFIMLIKTPLAAYLNTHPEIDFIVFTKGIPIRIYDVPNKPYGGVCALDSYVSALGYETSPTTSTVNISDPNYGATFVGNAYANKYWASTTAFSHASFGGYLVTRLDGFTQADAIAVTTRSLQAEANLAMGNTPTGNILLDADPTYGFPNVAAQPISLIPAGYVPGQTLTITSESAFGDVNADMQKTNTELLARSIPVQYNTTTTFVGNVTGLKGYYSWGSNDANYNVVAYNSLTFAPGAIAETAVSTSARTFLAGNPGQSKIADLISQGVTGVKGYTDEPLLQAIASPSILFDRYTKGWTLAESYYAASRLVDWMDIVIGDPICRAYSLSTLPIKLVAFNGNCINNKAILYWETSSEINNSYFNIEKSFDGISWKIIGKLNGQGNSSNSQKYNFTDIEKQAATTYYRLKQVDIDGYFTYSNILTIKNCNQRTVKFTISPNPVKDILTIKFDREIGKQAMQIFNINGQLVKDFFVENNTQISIADLPKAVYIIQLKKDKAQSVKFIKE
jgi:uncharacterized protein (TIGR03790 family)